MTKSAFLKTSAGVFAGALGLFLISSAPLASAQELAPPAAVPDAGPTDNGDAANFAVRISRLEDELRQLTGAVEELQNQNQRLEAELKRFREDVEFRLSGAKPPVAAEPSAAPTVASVVPAPEAPQPRRGDAFDPALEPRAPGAPQPLGSTAPSAPLANGLELEPNRRPAGAPLDLGKHSETPLSTPVAMAPPTGPLTGPTITRSGIDFTDAPRQQYDAAIDAYKAGQYDVAEAGFKAFLTGNANNRLVPDAVFYLGETYLQRSRPREAAEQYLKLSTDYARSAKAPEAMLRLGQSLALLGNTEQACATLAEVGKRYPTASASVKRATERELQKNHC